jgi:hypothetical protein
MLFTKKLVVLISFIFSVNLFAEANSSSEQKWMTDQEAMQPASSGTMCNTNPIKTKKIIDELEKKSLCKVGHLTQEECHALFLAGGAGVAGGIAAKTAAYLGSQKIKPDDVVCSDKQVSSFFYDLLIPTAQASFCFIRARGPLVVEAEKIASQVAAQKEEALNEFFKSSELQKPTMTPMEVDKQMKAKVAEYKALILSKSDISQNAKDRIIADMELGIRENRYGFIRDTILNSAKYQMPDYIPDTEGLNHLVTQRKASLFSLQAINDNAEKIKRLKTLLSDGSYGDEFIKSELNKFKFANPKLDVEAVMKRRPEIVNLTELEGRISGLVNQFNYDKITETQFMKNLSGLNFEKNNKAQVVESLQKILSRAKGIKVNTLDFSAISRGVARAGKGLLSVAGKAAMANPADMLIQTAVLGMPLNCEKNIAEMEGDGNKKFTMVGYNYMTLDDSTCKANVAIDEKFSKFFELDPIERVKLARYNPRLCGLINKLSEKEMIGSSYQIKCHSSSSFSLYEPSEAQLADKIKRETASDLNSSQVTNFNQVVSVSGDQMSVRFPNTTQALNSCKDFKVDLKSQSNSETRNKCNALTFRVSENIYDYAQISKCCAGDKNDYCDVFSKNFINSTDEIKSTGGSSSKAVDRRQ